MGEFNTTRIFAWSVDSISTNKGYDIQDAHPGAEENTWLNEDDSKVTWKNGWVGLFYKSGRELYSHVSS